jgi:NAD(P)-dependent dehydrogenase (short-subunit alcohol dehydrogenase family)
VPVLDCHTSHIAVKALFDKAKESFGKIHIVVNSARIILTNFPSLVETTEEELDWVAVVNTKGAFLVSREVAKWIPPGEGGRIVNITTTLVATTLPGNAAYTASNVAVENFTKTLAKEFGEVKSTGGSPKAPEASIEDSAASKETGRSEEEHRSVSNDIEENLSSTWDIEMAITENQQSELIFEETVRSDWVGVGCREATKSFKKKIGPAV